MYYIFIAVLRAVRPTLIEVSLYVHYMQKADTKPAAGSESALYNLVVETCSDDNE